MTTFCAIIGIPDGVEFLTIEAEDWEEAEGQAQLYARGHGSIYASVIWVETLDKVRQAYDNMGTLTLE